MIARCSRKTPGAAGRAADISANTGERLAP
jgi:hypothetical protein